MVKAHHDEHQGRKLTPPEVARRYRVSPDKVLIWIRRGELRAVNVATTAGGRPRFLIDEADLAVFENRRTAGPQPKVSRRRRATEAAGPARSAST